MARIRIAKATSGAAFVNKKKATEARLAAVESGQEVDEGPEDIFELQHHHLLRCLEKTTVSNTYEISRIFHPKNPKLRQVSGVSQTKFNIEYFCFQYYCTRIYYYVSGYQSHPNHYPLSILRHI